MLLSQLIKELTHLKEERGDFPVYMQFKKEDRFYFSIEKIFPDIVGVPNPNKGEGRLAEVIVLSSEGEQC